MKYLSLFSGIGGFELGIQNALSKTKREQQGRNERDLPINEQEQLGAQCIGCSEIDKYATQIYQKHFPEHKNYGNITTINATELPDFDLLVGGFPCQAFSIAGKRRGFDDTRGTLFFDIARILKEKRPRNFILENVKGLLSHDNGNTFKTIISTLIELGYCVEWQVLNAKNFGVPQNRERVFIVGHFGGIPERKVFPITESNGSDITQLNQPTHSNSRLYGTDGISPTLNTAQGGNRQPKIVASRGRNPANPSDRTTGSPTEQRLEVNESGTSNTLTNVQKDNWVLENSRIRRLTPLECERLMSYPDGWTEGLSDTQRYKTLGNGIVSNVVEEVVKRLLV